ncbi:hypothetical protein [Agrobacterium larrymoorei]|uniref:Nicotinamide riboside transporter PnuC n=1 Tax=Agrobacterium larrymoorei TaxID=160699 RepID=A0ABU0UM46_9HYPH|nr:hypothetical protein [Agrobacterium larrymoorei]MDQ1185961.1 hypothetical protein [Agrobacterium larrymoorei]
MTEGQIITLLINCGVGALIGANGSSDYGGAILWTIFAALAAFAAVVQGFYIHWLHFVAPVACAWLSAYLVLAKRRGDF